MLPVAGTVVGSRPKARRVIDLAGIGIEFSEEDAALSATIENYLGERYQLIGDAYAMSPKAYNSAMLEVFPSALCLILEGPAPVVKSPPVIAVRLAASKKAARRGP